MAISKPFAYNTGGPISGTTEYEDLAVGNIEVDYSLDYGGVKWWGGPNEELGYVIGNERPTGQPVPAGVLGGPAYVGFWRSKLLTDESFLSIANYVGRKNSQPPFSTTTDALTWLNSNGYYTSYSGGTEGFFILAQSGDILTAQNGNGIEYQHSNTPIVINGSTLFSGTNFLTVNGNTGTAMETVDFTWECWVYPTSSLEYQAFLDSRENPLEGGDTTGYYFGTNINTLTPIVYTNGVVLQATGDITLNDWNHVALTRSSGTINIWINGVNRGSTENGTNLTTQRIFIGGDAISNGLNLNGNLSNIRITKGVAVYTSNFTKPTTNFTVTQSANVNGNPSAAITAGQTQLLLNTNFGTEFLTDTSTNNFTVVNNGGVTSSNYEPFTPVPGF